MRYKTKVLLTGAGGAGTIEIIRSLRETGRYRIIALDASPYSVGLELADEAFVVPFAASPSFKPALRRVLAKTRPHFAIPLVDEEILDFHRIAPAFGTRVIAPTPTFCRIALDKWATFKALASAGLPVPDSRLASQPRGLRYPVIIKPRSGRGSRGLASLASTAELKAYLRKAPETADRYIVQEKLEGKEFTVSCVTPLGGPIAVVVPKEVILKKGITQVGVTRSNPAIDSVCRRLQEILRADGPFNVQLFLDRNGRPWIFEINPRYSTTVALTIASGVDEVDLVLRRALGQTIKKVSFTKDLLMVRYPTQLTMPERKWRSSQKQRKAGGQD